MPFVPPPATFQAGSSHLPWGGQQRVRLALPEPQKDGACARGAGTPRQGAPPPPRSTCFRPSSARRAPRPQAKDSALFVPGEVIVKYKPRRAPGDGLGALAAAAPPSLVQLDGETVEEALLRLAGDPAVEYAEPNLYVRAAWTTPTDPMYGGQWGMERVAAPLAWDSKAQLKGGARVCIVDTGVDCSHPDLARNCAGGANMQSSSSGGSGSGGGGLYAARDDNGHGTAIAGVVGAAGNNGGGVAGLAWRPSIYACKFMDEHGVGTTFGALRCLDWCIAQGTSVSVNAWGVEMSALSSGSAVWATTNSLRDRLQRTPSEHPPAHERRRRGRLALRQPPGAAAAAAAAAVAQVPCSVHLALTSRPLSLSPNLPRTRRPPVCGAGRQLWAGAARRLRLPLLPRHVHGRAQPARRYRLHRRRRAAAVPGAAAPAGQRRRRGGLG